MTPTSDPPKSVQNDFSTPFCAVVAVLFLHIRCCWPQGSMLESFGLHFEIPRLHFEVMLGQMCGHVAPMFALFVSDRFVFFSNITLRPPRHKPSKSFSQPAFRKNFHITGVGGVAKRFTTIKFWLRLIVGSAKSNLGRWMGHMPPIWTILCMCFALGLPQILGASRAASASPGGVYEKHGFGKKRSFRSQLFKPRCKSNLISRQRIESIPIWVQTQGMV